MYERVLIPLDGSELAEAILPFAEKIARPLDAEVLLVRVVERLSPVAALGTGGIAATDTLFFHQAEAKRTSRRWLRGSRTNGCESAPCSGSVPRRVRSWRLAERRRPI